MFTFIVSSKNNSQAQTERAIPACPDSLPLDALCSRRVHIQTSPPCWQLDSLQRKQGRTQAPPPSQHPA